MSSSSPGITTTVASASASGVPYWKGIVHGRDTIVSITILAAALSSALQAGTRMGKETSGTKYGTHDSGTYTLGDGVLVEDVAISTVDVVANMQMHGYFMATNCVGLAFDSGDKAFYSCFFES